MDFRCGFAAQINLRSLEYIALSPMGGSKLVWGAEENSVERIQLRSAFASESPSTSSSGKYMYEGSWWTKQPSKCGIAIFLRGRRGKSQIPDPPHPSETRINTPKKSHSIFLVRREVVPTIRSKRCDPQSRRQYYRGTLAFHLGLELPRDCGQPQSSLLNQLLDCC